MDAKLAVKLLLEDKEALGRLKSALGSIESHSKKSTTSLIKQWTQFTASITAAYLAVRGFIRLVDTAIENAKRQEDAVNRLNVALQNQGSYTVEVSTQYQEMAKDMQRSTRFSDEAIMETQQQLVAIGNVAPHEMERVTNAVLDFATATGRDANQAVLTVAKAMAGYTGELSRYGIILDQTLSTEEKREAALKFMEKRFGGSAQADVNNYAGATKQLSNAWGDLLEELGLMVTTSPEMIHLVQFSTKTFYAWGEAIAKNRHVFNDFLGSLEQAPLWIEAFSISLITGIEQIKERSVATGWQGIKNFVLFGPAGLGAAGPTLGEEVATPVITELEAQLEEIMNKINEKREEIKARNESAGSLLELATGGGKGAASKEEPAFVKAFQEGFGKVDTSAQGFLTNFGKGVGTATKQVSTMFSTTMTSIIMGEKKADEAFKELGKSLISLFIEMGIRIVAQQAIAMAANAIIGSVTKATMIGIAESAAPAAALVSLATMGANAVPASTGMIAAAATAEGIAALSAAGNIPGAEEGGTIARSGLTLIGERGPEILNLPRGAQVLPLGQSSGVTIHVSVTLNNPIVGSEEIARELGIDIGRVASEFIASEYRRL